MIAIKIEFFAFRVNFKPLKLRFLQFFFFIFVDKIVILKFKKIDSGQNVDIYPLKVPKHEIFHRSDFPDFYTIKSLRVGGFGVKIKKF
jgi:hypothetical protein